MQKKIIPAISLNIFKSTLFVGAMTARVVLLLGSIDVHGVDWTLRMGSPRFPRRTILRFPP
jgi:hypothetical protein